jgi:hypothetical protein
MSKRIAFLGVLFVIALSLSDCGYGYRNNYNYPDDHRYYHDRDDYRHGYRRHNSDLDKYYGY